MMHARRDLAVCTHLDHAQVTRLPESVAGCEDCLASGGKRLHLRICVSDLESASEEQIAAAIKGADAAVFAAGAGGGSTAARKLTMDRDGAIKLLHAAASAGVPRYLIISAGGAEDPPDGDDDLSIYLRAKADADAAVQSSDREWTILRPGALTDDRGTGRVRVDPTPGHRSVPRDDVAAVLARLLHDERAAHRALDINGGDQPLDQALATVLSG